MSAKILHDLASNIKATLATGAAEAPVDIAGRRFLARLESGNPDSFRLEQTEGMTVTGKSILEACLGKLPDELPDLTTDYLRLGAASSADTFDLDIPMKGNWEIPLGITSLQVSEVLASVTENSASLSGGLKGQCRFCGETTTVAVKLPGDVILSGTIPPIDLIKLITSVAGPILNLPAGVPSFGLGRSTYCVTFRDDHPILVVKTSSGDFKDVAVAVMNVDGKWGALAQIPLPVDNLFSNLSPSLAMLDQLLQVESPRLMISSFTTEDFSLPPLEAIRFDSHVSKGFSLLGSLKLTGGVLGLFGQILGVQELPLTLSATDSLDNAVIGAHRDGTINVVPGFLTLDNVTLTIVPAAADPIMPTADAHIDLFGVKLPLLKLGYSPTGVIELKTTEPFELPAVPTMKLKVNQTVIAFNPTGPQYLVGADIEFAKHSGKLAIQVLGQIPTLLLVKLPGKLSLSEVVKDLIDQSIPGVVDQTIEDFDLRFATQPAVVLGEQIGLGFSLRGTFGIAGLEMFVKIIIDPQSGVFAHGSLNKMVNVANVLKVSDATETGPPSMTLDTSKTPYLRLTGCLDLLGLKDSIDATVDKSGFETTLNKDLGIAHFQDVRIRYKSPRDCSASGSFTYGIDLKTDPIRSSNGGPSLGALTLNATFRGDIDLTVANGTFGVRERRISLA